MNSPGIYADFLAIVILLTLHRLSLKRLWLLFPLLLCTTALVLTFVRTAWLELAVGLIVYLLLSPRRGIAIATVGVTALITLLIAMNLSIITGDASSNTQLQSRIATLNDLQEDSSANARSDETANALHQSIAEPLGQGLGSLGTATKLGAAGANTVLDNGYLTRFQEMGVFGFFCYLASLAVALVLSLMRLGAAHSTEDREAAALLSTSVAVQVALLAAELSADHHSAILGILFWMSVGLTSSVRPRAADPKPLDLFGRQPPSMNRPARA